ncbi:MAG: PAS domain-containing protein [Geminicoccaceae bacterium]|nr:PAS domain-containing protein [Geminicoccaceae bacterium]
MIAAAPGLAGLSARPPVARAQPRPIARLSGILLAGAAALALALGAERLIAERRDAELAALEARLAALAAGRAEVLATWLDGLVRLAARLTGSELVRLFAHEATLAQGDARLAPALAEQAPYMRLVLEELARQSGLEGAGLLARDGSWLLRDAALRLPDSVLRTLAQALESGSAGPRSLLLAHERGTRLVLAVPLPPPEAAAGEAPRAAVVLVVPAGDRLARLLGPQPLDGAGVRARLEADRPDGTVLRIGADAATEQREPPSATADPRVAVPVAGLPWRVILEADLATVLAPHTGWAWTVRAAAGGLWLAGVALVLALLARQASRHQRALAEQYRETARAIDAERRLLEEIASAVPDLVSLKDARGRYVFVNRALANALGRGAHELLGRREEEVLEPDSAAKFAALERSALASGAAVQPELALVLGGRRRVLHTIALGLPDPSGGPPRILRVARDLTELAAERHRSARLREQLVSALLRTIELADPYLLGHSRMVAELAERLAVRLALDPETIATVRLAGELSQIGKLFVPRDLLTKEGRHTAEESAMMRRHVEHALAVLGGVEFDLPVATAIAQMHERLDGTGYPRGLAGTAIGPAGRVLAVADVFVARTRPRSYRDAASSEHVLAVLRDHPERYDAAVVAALEEELATVAPAAASDAAAALADVAATALS